MSRDLQGGRARPDHDDEAEADEREDFGLARGRYGRNAMVQGAAAEFFKTWAVIVRARLPVGAHIVLCLHDELLVHVPTSGAAEVATIVDEALQETAVRWAQPELRDDVRFTADTSVIARWSDAK